MSCIDKTYELILELSVVIVIIFLIVWIISLFLFIFNKRKYNNSKENNNEVMNNKIKKTLYGSSMIIILIFIIHLHYFMLLYLGGYKCISIPVFLLILMVISMLFKIKGNKRISYTICICVCIIIIVIVGGSILLNTIEENRNNAKQKEFVEDTISAFNSKLTPYIGENITGSQVNALLRYCLSNNMKATQNGETYKYITVTCTYKNNGKIETMEVNGESESYTKVPTGGTYYTVLGEYDSYGLMTIITVTQNE